MQKRQESFCQRVYFSCFEKNTLILSWFKIIFLESRKCFSISLRLLHYLFITWRSGHCYLNKAECNSSKSKDDFFVEWVAKNNSWNNGDHHKFHEIILIKCFVFFVTLVLKTVNSSAMTQIKVYFNGKKHCN